MALNPSIILSGQVPDTVNTLARSTAAAAGANENQRRNALAATYKQHGPGILAGDKSALNVLAQQDPTLALGVQNTLQDNRIAERNLGMREQEFELRLNEYARGLSAAEAASKAAEVEAGIVRGISAFQSGDLGGVNAILQEAGEQPLQSLDQFPAVAARYGKALDVLKSVSEFSAGPKPADQYQRYVQETTAAGQTPLSRIEFAQAIKGKGFSVKTADGTTVTYGGSADSGPKGPEDPSSAVAMINTIDGILNDPALDFSTGIMSPLQNVPGTPMKRFQGRANQLSGQAFLQAFESLKGGGQITELEGAQATQAIGRLDTAQRAEDYRDALIELRSILTVASERPIGWVETQRKINSASDIIPAEQIKSMTPDQIRGLGPEGLLRVPASELKGLSDEQWDALESLAGDQ